MATREQLLERYEIEMELLRRRALTDLLAFIKYNNPNYKANWHHTLITQKIDAFLNDPEQKRLMLFVPPQHGKSEITSRSLPAYAFGKNPDLKIACASYSLDLARSFNRNVQRIMDSKEYGEIFPNSRLNGSRVAFDDKGGYLRNTEEFEIVGHKGYYKAVGVMGGLSGRTVDLAIIDDPVKDAIEANSTVYRDRVWDWYVNVLETRLNNRSKVILIMTRWHEDDLAGRLLARQPEKWTVIKFPAVREDLNDPDDPRQVGEPLWPEWHSLQKLNDLRALSETTFASLYQQRPAPAEGNKVKRDWFQFCHEKELPGGIIWDLWVDGAYTKNTANDPTGLMVAGYHPVHKRMYIRYAHHAYLEMPGLLKLIPEVARGQGLNGMSRVRIEPKASGHSLKQMLNNDPTNNLNAVEIKNSLVQDGKEARLQVAAPKIEAGRVVLVEGNWNDKFITQICSFPNATHDEYVDLIGYACHEYMDEVEREGVAYY